MTDKTDSKEREAFEAWASDGGRFPKAVERSGDGYKLAFANTSWTVWKARASLAASAGGPVACGNCGGTGRMVRDPDIGTDQECFVCEGSGHYSDAAPPTAQAGGWRLVPVEPTTDQEWAGKQAALRGSTMAEACKIYKAMLAAAPTPPTSAEGVEHG